MERGEDSYTAGANVNEQRPCGKRYGGFIKNGLAILIHITWYRLEIDERAVAKKYLHHHIHNSQNIVNQCTHQFIKALEKMW